MPTEPTTSSPRRSHFFARSLVIALAASLSVAGAACNGSPGRDRWVATENTNVEIDWDAINQAYKDAEGPEDLEKRVNEIYTGDEIISVAVQDVDDKSQVVTGFFDNNENGKIDETEKVFTIQRDIVDPAKAQYAISGHGAYGYYHSPMWDIAAGMMMGSMMSRMFMPGYTPMYRTPYTTSPAARGAIASQRSSFRAANPSRFPPKASGSGRSYGGKGGAFGGSGSGRSGGGRMGGGRFGVRRPADRKVVRLAV